MNSSYQMYSRVLLILLVFYSGIILVLVLLHELVFCYIVCKEAGSGCNLLCFRGDVEKRTALENLDLILLCIDEIIDGG